MSSPKWYALTVLVEAEATEAVAYALMEAGALGTETSNAEEGMRQIISSGPGSRIGDGTNRDEIQFPQVTGYFDTEPDREKVRAEMLDALRVYGLPSSSVREMDVRAVPDQDWLGEWKKSWQPVQVGERFIIAPPWASIDDEPGRIVIRIEPGMAFGTGTHETTRLCLLAIEKHFTGGSFLDVGTGTGVLAIAAAKLVPDARIEACDTDADAIEIARENARLNLVGDAITFQVGTVNDCSRSADLVCANLTADVIQAILPSLLDATCGRLILSGILESQVGALLDHLFEHGRVQSYDLVRDGEWVAIVV